MEYSVYFKGVLNTNNGYFHLKNMTSAAHTGAPKWRWGLVVATSLLNFGGGGVEPP